jgi:hypothetical protein
LRCKGWILWLTPYTYIHTLLFFAYGVKAVGAADKLEKHSRAYSLMIVYVFDLIYFESEVAIN